MTTLSEENRDEIKARCAELKKKIDDIRADQDDLSYAEIGRQTGISGPTLSQVLDGRYRGRIADKIETLENWIVEFKSRQGVESLIGHVDHHVPTPTSQRIVDMFTYARAGKTMAAIIGPPGLSKSLTGRTEAKNKPNTHYIELDALEGTPSNMIHRIHREMDLSRALSLSIFNKKCQIIDVLKRPNSLLIIDEANHLENKALETLRGIHDRTQCGLVLMGNQFVLSRLSGHGHEAAFSQITSRIGMPLRLPSVPTDADVWAILDAKKIGDADVRRLLLKIAQDKLRGGGLRQMSKVIKLALTQTRGRALLPKHVRAANNHLTSPQT